MSQNVHAVWVRQPVSEGVVSPVNMAETKTALSVQLVCAIVLLIAVTWPDGSEYFRNRSFTIAAACVALVFTLVALVCAACDTATLLLSTLCCCCRLRRCLWQC